MHATPRSAGVRTLVRFASFHVLSAGVLASSTMAGGGKAPPNDECQSAIAIGAGDVAFTTVGATSSGPDLPDSCNEGFGLEFAPDVWFAVTPSEDTGIIVSTCNQADFDTRLAAYEGCGGPLVACNDDGDGCGFTSFMSFPALADQTYFVRVGGYGAATGSGTVSVTFGDAPAPYPTQITPQWRVEDGGNGHYYAIVRLPEDVRHRRCRGGVVRRTARFDHEPRGGDVHQRVRAGERAEHL